MTGVYRSLSPIYSLATIFSLIFARIFTLSFNRGSHFTINRRIASGTDRPISEMPISCISNALKGEISQRPRCKKVRYPSHKIRKFGSASHVYNEAAKVDWVSVHATRTRKSLLSARRILLIKWEVLGRVLVSFGSQ